MSAVILGSLPVYALALFLLVRWEPDYIQTFSGDEAFTYTFHHFFAKGAIYGRDITTTAGPWSILHYRHYYPETFWVFLFGQIAIAASIATALVPIGQYFSHWLSRWIFIASTLAGLSVSPDARFYFMSLAAVLFLPDYRTERFSLLHTGLMAFVGFSCLIKSTLIPIALVILVIVLGAETIRGRKAPFAALTLVLALFAFNAFAGQPASGLASFFHATFTLSSGYPERFSELGSLIELAIFLVVCSVAAAMIGVGEFGRWGRWGALQVLGYLAIFFVIFKASFVRQDGEHVIRAFFSILPFAVAYAAIRSKEISFGLQGFGWLWPVTQTWRAYRTVFLFVAGVVVVMICGVAAVRYPTLYAGKIQKLASNARGIAEIASSGREYFQARHEDALQRVRREQPLPALDGTVAVFSVLQTPAIAHGLGFTSLPTSVPYHATTPSSDTLNALFLSAADGPQYVLFQPYFAHGAAGLTLLQHYRPVDTTKAFLVLERRSAPLTSSIVSTVDATAQWNQTLPVPDAGGDVVQVDLHYRSTVLEKALSFIYQPAPVYLAIDAGDAQVTRIRLNQSLAEQGLIVSPPLNSRASFVAAGLSGMATSVRSTSIRVEMGEPGGWLFAPESWRLYFQPDIGVTFRTLAWDVRQNDPPAERLASVERLLQMRCECRSPSGILIDVGDGQPALAISAGTPWHLLVRPDINRVRLGFGGLATSDDIVLRALLLSSSQASPVELWSQPVRDKMPQTVDLVLPFGGTDGTRTLVLVAASSSNRQTPAAYLTDIKPYASGVPGR